MNDVDRKSGYSSPNVGISSDTNTGQIRHNSISEISLGPEGTIAATIAAANAEKSEKLRELMQQQRETNIISALRLIRHVSKPVPNLIPREKKKKRGKSATEKQLTLLQNIGNEEQLVLHKIDDIYKEASTSFHHRTKKSPLLVKMEEHEANASRLQFRPQSASLVAEIMAEEGAKAKQLFLARKAREQRRRLQTASAWSNLDTKGQSMDGGEGSTVLGVGQFSSDLAGESEDYNIHLPPRRHPMLPASTVSKSSFGASAGGTSASDSWGAVSRPSTAGARLAEVSGVKQVVGKVSMQEKGRKLPEPENNQMVPIENRKPRMAIFKEVAQAPQANGSHSALPLSRSSSKGDSPKRTVIKRHPSSIEMKERSEQRLAHMELQARQTAWLRVIMLAARTRLFEHVVEKGRTQKIKIVLRRMQKSAVQKIETFWESFRMKSIMRKNQRSTKIIRACIMSYWRRKQVRRRREYVKLIVKFVTDTSGVSERTQKLYRYRAKVVKIQRWVREFISCQPARIQLLSLCLAREISRKRVLRNRQLSENERKSIRKMKNTAFFGPTVQKLDEIYNSLSSLMLLKAQAYKALMQKQRHIENLATTRPVGGSRHRSRADSPSRRISRKYKMLLRKVLMMQRRRHMLSEADSSPAIHTKLHTKQAVSEKEVKTFLQTENHPGPTFIFHTADGFVVKKRNIFLLLTGGAQRELEFLAYEIVVSEEDSKRGASDGRSYLSTQSSMVSGDDCLSPTREERNDHDHDDDFLFDEDEDW